MTDRNKIYKITTEKNDGSRAKVALVKDKCGGTWQFVNLSKGHICPCRFNTVADAVKDLDSYVKKGKIKRYNIVNRDNCCKVEGNGDGKQQ